MQLTTAYITKRYNQGVSCLTDITNNKFLRTKYGVQFKTTNLDNRILMLLTALESWSNKTGATNILTERQMMAILDQIGKGYRDNLSTTSPSADAVGGVNQSTGSTGNNGNGGVVNFSLVNTQSINLTMSNGVLRADLRVSPTSGNKAVVSADGLYVTQDTTIIKYIQGSDFNAGTNRYDNSSLAGRSLQIWHRGLGFLLYNYDNPSDPNNEFSILPEGGFIITIPGFDVHDGNNYFHIIS
jgi:hypothetical protein